MKPIPGHLTTHPAHSGAEAAALALRRAGIEAVFLAQRSELTRELEQAVESVARLQSTRLSGEAAAVHAAGGYARRTGRAAAVVLGPGASFARAVPALATALLDCVPIVCLCIETPQAFVGPGASTEWDVMGLSMPATKWAGWASQAGEIGSQVCRAAAVAMAGRKGPTVLAAAPEVLAAAAPAEWEPQDGHHDRGPQGQVPRKQLDRVLKLIEGVRRPLLYCGGGVVRSGPAACAALQSLANLSRIPCVLTWGALDALPADDRHRLGLVGPYGDAVANAAMRHADLVIALGARFNENLPAPALLGSATRHVVHVDIDPVSINRVVRADVPIVGDCGAVLERLVELASETGLDGSHLGGWWAQLADIRTACETVADQPEGRITRSVLAQALGTCVTSEVVVSLDASRHTNWLAAHLRFSRPGQWLATGPSSEMPGQAVMAAVGALVAATAPLNPLLCLTDERSLLALAGELPVLAAAGWPLKLVCVNTEPGGIDTRALAEACRWSAARADDPAMLPQALQDLMASPGPALLQIEMGRRLPRKLRPESPRLPLSLLDDAQRPAEAPVPAPARR